MRTNPKSGFLAMARLLIRTMSIRGASWLLLGLSLWATAVFSQQVWQGQREARETRFQADVAILGNAIEERLQRYAQVLQGVRGLFAASDEVTRSEFEKYAGNLRQGNNSLEIRALGFIEWVDHASRGAFVEKAAAEHGDTFRILPAGDRPEYLVVRFVEPLEANRMALGFDICRDEVLKTAAMRSRDSESPALSGRVEMWREANRTAIVMFVPVYSGSDSSGSGEGHPAGFVGWVCAAFAPDDMMAKVRQFTTSVLACDIHDGADPAADNLLYRCDHEPDGVTGEELVQTTTLPAFGRQWTIRTHAPMGHFNGTGMLPVVTVGVGGACMSLLIFGIAHLLANTGRRAYALANAMTVEIRRQEEALRVSEERLAMVIKGSNDGFWDWNLITNEVYFSPRFKSMLGYADHEMENSLGAWKSHIHPDDLARARQTIRGYLEGNLSTYQLEHRLRHKDGSYRWILARGVAVRDSSGRTTRLAGSHVDLTELKRAEQELRAANRGLQDSQARLQATLADLSASHQKLEATQLELIQAAKLESVGTLAAGVAHEVKNPLQIIIMGLDLLDCRCDAADEVVRTTLGDMRDAVLRADTITRELLHFSTATEFTPCPADLEAVIERSLWLLRTDITKAGVTVVKRFSGKLPLVAIDIQKIQQVLINLTNNSLQAMVQGGTLTLTTLSGRFSRSLSSRHRSGGHLGRHEPTVILRIHDTGPGIPPDQLQRIFDPFFTTKAVGFGSGLGLSVVKKIVDLHHGVIHFQNSPRGGLVVTLVFPALQDTATAPASEAVLTA